MVITPAFLIAAGASHAGAALYGPPLAASCAKRGLVANADVVDLLANVLNESGALTRVSEDLTYTSAAWLQEVFASHFPTVASAAPFVRNPRGLGDKVYGAIGGYEGRGLGLPQLTGTGNHTAYGADVGMGLAAVRAHLLTPEGAADSAVWFYVHAGCGAFAAHDDLVDVRRRWAGTPAGRTPFGLAQVETWQSQLLRALGAPTALHAGTPSGKPAAPTPAAPKPRSAGGSDDLNQAELDTLKGAQA